MLRDTLKIKNISNKKFYFLLRGTSAQETFRRHRMHQKCQTAKKEKKKMIFGKVYMVKSEIPSCCHHTLKSPNLESCVLFNAFGQKQKKTVDIFYSLNFSLKMLQYRMTRD